MQDPTKYNKKYFMACATYWYLEHHTTDHLGWGDDDIVDAMEEIGVPEKYYSKIIEMVEEFDL